MQPPEQPSEPKSAETSVADVAADEPLPPAPTPEQVEKAERLIRESRLQKIRGNKSVAGKLLEEALEVAPGSVTVMEAVADDLMDRRQTKAAMEIYKRAMGIDPKNVSVERKYAECVLGAARYADPFSVTQASELDAASGRTAVILSLILPGLGQMVTGRVSLGVGLMAGWLGGWGIAWLIPNGMKGLFTMVNIKTRGEHADFNVAVLFPLAIAAICHLWAIYEAASRAGTRKQLKIDRPVPPVNKDFEI
jgi:tetratricopeptide (TPR) repeat protein